MARGIESIKTLRAFVVYEHKNVRFSDFDNPIYRSLPPFIPECLENASPRQLREG